MNTKNRTFLGLTKEQLNEYICPLLMADSVFFASLYTFNKPSAFILTAVYVLVSAMLFRFFDRLRNKKSGAFVYALVLAAVLFVSFAMVVIHAASFGYYSPMRWFYAQDDSDAFQPLLTAALALGGGFFLTSIIYYFTAVRYRTMGVMLCTMFPFFFFAKRSDIMPNILITLIMLLFLAVVIHNKRIDKTGKYKENAILKVDRAYIICISVFVLIVGAVTMAAEKPYYQAFLEKNSRLFTPFNYGGGNSSGYEELSEQSSPRNGRPNYSYEPLFYLATDSDEDEVFLRTKAFDIFNGDVWVNRESYAWTFYSLQLPEYSVDDIASDMSVLTGEDLSGNYSVQSARVFDEDFTPIYLPAPYGIITDNRPQNALKYFKLRSDTAVWRSLYYYYLPELDDEFTYFRQKESLRQFAEKMNFNSDGYLEYLASFGESEQAKRLADDYRKALKDYTDLSNISERLTQLSQSVTADCRSDIEKAKKLESYFTENGFSYSLDYVPEDNSVDYFVFESKTGYCAGYATAMTLMARAVGLPARYVEGFAAFEKDENGQFIVRDGYAHAFVEIYIPGAGWLTFDPTVSGYRENPNAANGANAAGILLRIYNALNRVSVIIVIAAIVLIFSLLDRIKELLLRLSLHFKPVNERIIRLYGNLIKVAGNSAGEDLTSYTPDLLREYLLSEKGVAPEKLIELFKKTAFGGYDCTQEEYSAAYKEYKKCLRQIRRPASQQKAKGAQTEA